MVTRNKKNAGHAGNSSCELKVGSNPTVATSEQTTKGEEMHESEAYPNGMKWNERAQQKFNKNDVVRVGASYRAYDSYRTDGTEGLYFVIKELDKGDYYLSKTKDAKDHDWDLICHASRLVLMPVN